MRGYVALSLSIASELFGTTMLKLSAGFSQLWPSLGVLLGFGCAFYCLSLCLKSIPLSVAYAIWSGVGTAATAVIGILAWGEAFHLLTAVGLILIIGGVVLLNTPAPSVQRSKQTST